MPAGPAHARHRKGCARHVRGSLGADRSLRPEPDRAVASRQPAHGLGGVAVRPLGRQPRSCFASRTSIARRVGRSTRHPSARPRRPSGLDWDEPVVRQSERFDRYREVIDRLVAAGPDLSVLLHVVARCSRRRRRRTSTCPRVRIRDLPELSRRRTGGARRRRVGLPRCDCVPTAPSQASTTRCTVGTRAWSTTSSSAATTAPRPTTSRSWSTTPTPESSRSCGVTTCWPARLARCLLARWLGLADPERTPTCRWCSGPTASGWPSGTAR